KPAAQSANTVAIHCRCARLSPTSAPISGSATLRIEKSTARVKPAVKSTASASWSRGAVRVSVDMPLTVRRAPPHSQTPALPSPDRVPQPWPARRILSAMAPLGEFLRSRRALVTPEQVGISSFGTRRVPGLRREELAQLAGVSLTYYTRL